MSMEDLLGALLKSGMQSQQQPAQRGGDPTAQLLQSLLGGAQPQQQQPQPTGLEMLLTGALGSGTAAQPGGGMDLASLAQNPMVLQMLTPLITPLAQKLNISPQIAMIIVTFALQALLANRGKKTAAATRGAAGLNLNGLLAQAGSKQGITPAYVQSTGMARELSQKSGLDETTAARGLLEVFQMLGSRASEAGIKATTVKKSAAPAKKPAAKPAAKKSAASKSTNPKKGGKARR